MTAARSTIWSLAAPGFGGARGPTSALYAVLDASATGTTAYSPSPALLQRSCRCGHHALAGGECESCRSRPEGLQTTLTVSQPGDEHELEADRAADAVMRMEDPLAPGIEPETGRHVLAHTLRPTAGPQRAAAPTAATPTAATPAAAPKRTRWP